MKTFAISSLVLLAGLLATPTLAKSNSLSSRSLHGNSKDAHSIASRMHRQRRTARQEQRRKRSLEKEQKRSDLAALLAAKMVSKKATRSSLGEGTVDVQPDNIAAGTATAEEGCTLWHTVIDGEVCLGVIDKSDGLTLEDFYGLNPAVGPGCDDLRVGVAYCIDTDHQEDSAASSASTCKTTSTSATVKNSSTDTTGESDDSNDDQDPTSTSSASRNGSTAIAPVEAQSKTVSSYASTSTGGSSSGATDEAGFKTAGTIKISGSGATTAISPDGGPNGKTWWLNNGISKSNPSSPWNPPTIAIHDLVVKELSSDGIFAPCTQYFDLFEKYGKLYDIPPILIASFAMQESTCQAGARGDNGHAYGLMQITRDKCDGSVACDDPEYNIRTGAKYFRDTLDAMNGNFLRALGQYNGWPEGMTYAHATAAAYTSCCVCQNNLDYLAQMVNGWMQGVSGGTIRPFNNLAVCGGSQSGNSKRSVAGSAFMSKWVPSS